MTTQLSPDELQAAEGLLQDYAPARDALVTLREQDNVVEVALTETVEDEPCQDGLRF